MIQVALQRKRSSVPYPKMYEEADNSVFNCYQRAHHNTLESYPAFLTLLLIAGLAYPITASAGLDYQGIRGQLGDSVAAFQHLQSLNMSNNLLTGAIPDAIGNLSTVTRMKIKMTRQQMGARVLVTAWLLIYCNRSQYLFAAQASPEGDCRVKFCFSYSDRFSIDFLVFKNFLDICLCQITHRNCSNFIYSCKFYDSVDEG